MASYHHGDQNHHGGHDRFFIPKSSAGYPSAASPIAASNVSASSPFLSSAGLNNNNNNHSSSSKHHQHHPYTVDTNHVFGLSSRYGGTLGASVAGSAAVGQRSSSVDRSPSAVSASASAAAEQYQQYQQPTLRNIDGVGNLYNSNNNNRRNSINTSTDNHSQQQQPQYTIIESPSQFLRSKVQPLTAAAAAANHPQNTNSNYRNQMNFASYEAQLQRSLERMQKEVYQNEMVRRENLADLEYQKKNQQQQNRGGYGNGNNSLSSPADMYSNLRFFDNMPRGSNPSDHNNHQSNGLNDDNYAYSLGSAPQQQQLQQNHSAGSTVKNVNDETQMMMTMVSANSNNNTNVMSPNDSNNNHNNMNGTLVVNNNSSDNNSAAAAMMVGLHNSANMTTLPVHEYWLEHKAVMQQELLWQREALLGEITRADAEILMQTNILREKAGKELEFVRADGKEIVDNLVKFEQNAWKSVKRRELQVFQMQHDFNEVMSDLVNNFVEREFEIAARENALRQRRYQIEMWAGRLHSEMMVREVNIARISREAQRDVHLMANRQREASATQLRNLRGLGGRGSNKNNNENSETLLGRIEIDQIVNLSTTTADGTTTASTTSVSDGLSRLIPGVPFVISGRIAPQRFYRKHRIEKQPKKKQKSSSDEKNNNKDTTTPRGQTTRRGSTPSSRRNNHNQQNEDDEEEDGEDEAEEQFTYEELTTDVSQLEGTPICITYYEGTGGKVSGTICAIIDAEGRFSFSGVCFTPYVVTTSKRREEKLQRAIVLPFGGSANGAGPTTPAPYKPVSSAASHSYFSGTSHSILISIPKTHAGVVQPKQCVISLKANHLRVPKRRFLSHNGGEAQRQLMALAAKIKTSSSSSGEAPADVAAASNSSFSAVTAANNGNSVAESAAPSPAETLEKIINFTAGGEWETNICRLNGQVTFHPIEPFGLFGVEIEASIRFTSIQENDMLDVVYPTREEEARQNAAATAEAASDAAITSETGAAASIEAAQLQSDGISGEPPVSALELLASNTDEAIITTANNHQHNSHKNGTPSAAGADDASEHSSVVDGSYTMHASPREGASPTDEMGCGDAAAGTAVDSNGPLLLPTAMAAPPSSSAVVNAAMPKRPTLDVTTTFKLFGNELNQFPFSLNMLGVRNAPTTWADLVQPSNKRHQGIFSVDQTEEQVEAQSKPEFSRVFMKLKVPATKYSDAFEHEFEINTLEIASERPYFIYEAGAMGAEVAEEVPDHLKTASMDSAMTPPTAAAPKILSAADLEKDKRDKENEEKAKRLAVEKAEEERKRKNAEAETEKLRQLVREQQRELAAAAAAAAKEAEEKKQRELVEFAAIRKRREEEEAAKIKKKQDDAEAAAIAAELEEKRKDAEIAEKERQRLQKLLEEQEERERESKRLQALREEAEAADAAAAAVGANVPRRKSPVIPHRGGSNTILKDSRVATPASSAAGSPRSTSPSPNYPQGGENHNGKINNNGASSPSPDAIPDDVASPLNILATTAAALVMSPEEEAAGVAHGQGQAVSEEAYLDFRAINVPIHDVAIGSRMSSDGNFLGVVDARGSLRIYVKKAAASKMDALREGSPKSIAAASAIANSNSNSVSVNHNNASSTVGGGAAADISPATANSSPNRQPSMRGGMLGGGMLPSGVHLKKDEHRLDDAQESLRQPTAPPPPMPPQSLAEHCYWSELHIITPPEGQPFSGTMAWGPMTTAWKWNNSQNNQQQQSSSAAAVGGGGGGSSRGLLFPPEAKIAIYHPHTQTVFCWKLNLLKELSDAMKRQREIDSAQPSRHPTPNSRSSGNTTPNRSARHHRSHHHGGGGGGVGGNPNALSLTICEPAAQKLSMPDAYILDTTGNMLPSASDVNGGRGGVGNANYFSGHPSNSSSRAGTPSRTHASKPHPPPTTASNTNPSALPHLDSPSVTTVTSRNGTPTRTSSAMNVFVGNSPTGGPRRSYSTVMGRNVVDLNAVVFEAQFVSTNGIALLNHKGQVYYGVFGTTATATNNKSANNKGQKKNATAADNDDDELNFTISTPLAFFNLAIQDTSVVFPNKPSALRATCLATFPSVSSDLVFVGYNDMSLAAFSILEGEMIFSFDKNKDKMKMKAQQREKEKAREMGASSAAGVNVNNAPAATADPINVSIQEEDDPIAFTVSPLRFFGASPYGPFMFFGHAFGVIMVKLEEILAAKAVVNWGDRSANLASSPTEPFFNMSLNGGGGANSINALLGSPNSNKVLGITATHYSAEEIAIGDPDGGDVARIFAIVPLNTSLVALLYDTNDCFLVDFGHLRSDPAKFVITAAVLGAEDPDVAIQSSMDFRKTVVMPQVAAGTSLVLGVDAMGPLCWQVALTQ